MKAPEGKKKDLWVHSQVPRSPGRFEAVKGPGQVAFYELLPRKWCGVCVRGERRGTDGRIWKACSRPGE